MLSKRLSRWNFDHEKNYKQNIKKNCSEGLLHNCVPCVIFISSELLYVCIRFWHVFTFFCTHEFFGRRLRFASVIYWYSVEQASELEYLCGNDKWEVNFVQLNIRSRSGLHCSCCRVSFILHLRLKNTWTGISNR